MIGRWLHRIAHRLGWHHGRVVSALDRNGTVWIAFCCGKCGKLNGIHAAYSYQPKPEEFH